MVIKDIKERLAGLGFISGMDNRFFRRVGELMEIDIDDFGFITVIRKSEVSFKSDRNNYSKVTLPKKIETEEDVAALVLLFRM
ncbi:MAG: hypothetical protein KAT04_12980 [Methylococcales bacterium]|nr:hypothetical protein [Methylococcales bacterium]